MELSINGRNMHLSERVKAYAEKKTARLDRYMPDLRAITVDISVENSKNASKHWRFYF